MSAAASDLQRLSYRPKQLQLRLCRVQVCGVLLMVRLKTAGLGVVALRV